MSREWMNVVLSDFAINILPFHRITTIKFVSHIFFLCSAIFFPSRQLQLFNFFTPDLSKQFVDLMVFVFNDSSLFLFFSLFVWVAYIFSSIVYSHLRQISHSHHSLCSKSTETWNKNWKIVCCGVCIGARESSARLKRKNYRRVIAFVNKVDSYTHGNLLNKQHTLDFP